MINLTLKIISRLYNECLEDISTRILYFFNTIDTYFLFAGISSFIIAFRGEVNVMALALSLLLAVTSAKIADFYPTFLLFAIPALAAAGMVLPLSASLLAALFLANCALFFIIQFLFMGIPNAIVARDIRVPFIVMYNSLFTVAPTTVSFLMSVFFSFYLSFLMAAAAASGTARDYGWLGGLGAVLFAAALIARLTRPKNRFSKFHRPDVRGKPLFQRVVILNIDGVRQDIFNSLNLPAISRLAREGASHALGLETVYRALTNPAFASIFTGTIPRFHGVSDNNFGQSIRTEGLPDIVPSIAYGSMHVKHFCKQHWRARIVSLPRHSIYRSDDIMMGWLKDDMLKAPEARLFIADFSEADFLAHAYGSRSGRYKQALQRIDKRIGDFLDWLKASGLSDSTAVIVCSDHGIAAIDHSYLIAESERYVPFLIYGKGVKKGLRIQRPGRIMDICSTVSYLLGVRYPCDSRGQVFTEALEGFDPASEQEAMVNRFNQLKYDAEAGSYPDKHLEIYDGDAAWWDECILRFARGGKENLKVLDIGCGNGFVGERFAAMGVDFKEFVCMDVSQGILDGAKKALAGYPGFSFANCLGDVKGRFGIITANSIFHHLAHPQKLAKAIDGLLEEGGIVLGAHEPNKRVFQNRLFSAAAGLYKKMGGGITIGDEIVEEFNRLLRARYPAAPRVCREEILQMTEYHSPLEQYDRGVDAEEGFMPEIFLKSHFPGYAVLALETYTTFFHRPRLSGHKGLQTAMAAVFNLLFREGNLFRFVLRKEGI